MFLTADLKTKENHNMKIATRSLKNKPHFGLFHQEIERKLDWEFLVIVHLFINCRPHFSDRCALRLIKIYESTIVHYFLYEHLK
jgi:hypothetical protein